MRSGDTGRVWEVHAEHVSRDGTRASGVRASRKAEAWPNPWKVGHHGLGDASQGTNPCTGLRLVLHGSPSRRNGGTWLLVKAHSLSFRSGPWHPSSRKFVTGKLKRASLWTMAG